MIHEDEAKKILDYMNEYKQYVGLGQWEVYLEPKYLERGDALAEIESDIYECRLTLQVSEDALTEDEGELEKILLHELIHARVLVFGQKVKAFTENIVEEEEEFMVNDLTRGLYDLVKKYYEE